MKNLAKFVALAVISATLPPAAAQNCTENFDGVTAPALPGGWQATNVIGPPPLWVTSISQSFSPPNCAFVPNAGDITDKRLDSRPILITSASAVLSFRNNYDTEYDPPPAEVFYDGYVLEVSTDGGANYSDVIEAGGVFVSGPYTGEIFGSAGNPLAGRMAWCGETGGYIDTVINLPASLNGQTIVLRFRIGTDDSIAAPGVRIDNIVITCSSPTPTGPFIVNTLAEAADDDGVCTTSHCTLREALNAVNQNFDHNTVTFAQNVTGAINLTSSGLVINSSLTINGPGANVLSVQRSSAAGTPEFRIFSIESAGINVTITGLTIANGKVSGFFNPGGGILNAGTLTLAHSTLSGNSSGSSGGGISNNNSSGTLTLTNATVSDNSAGTGGGGISGGTVNVTNSTISGNMATSGEGGGIAVTELYLVNSTITGNSASSGSGGGIYNSGSSGTSVKARNTIIALNTAASGPDVQGPLTSENFNLIGNGAGATISPAQFGDQIGVTADQLRLGPLQNNGGITETHALFSGSVAIDKGHSGGATTDQRGFTRPADQPTIENASGGDGADIGAFEVQAPTPTPTPTPSPTATPIPASLGNISTRLRVETGDNVLIGGFIITGTQPKKVIVRGIGTSLPFVDRLENPTLELRDGSGALVESNDNWMDSPNKQAIIDSTIPPSNDLESAIVATVPANNAGYTAIVRGVEEGTGIGVVEAYDLDTSVDSKLANISTRGFVQTGDNVLIAGTIVVGQASQKVIVRAIGPSLDVPGKLEDPTLELRDANGDLVAANDNWRSDQEAEIIATTIPPTNDLESAIVATLPANNASYTAIVRGVGDTTGIAVVEVYALN